MKGFLTQKQEISIKRLQAALLSCMESGIKLCAMDGTIYYANKQALNHYKPKLNKGGSWGDYPEVAQCQNLDQSVIDGGLNGTWVGSINDHGSYTDSGGW